MTEQPVPVSPFRRHGTDAVRRSAERRGETTDQVLDRNVNELLQELRVAFTGVQILFAFLLGLAFTSRFAELDGFGVAVYTAPLLLTALATVTLIAPVSFHRIVFRQRKKAQVVAVADRLLMAGLGMLMTAICLAVLLIVDVVLGRWAAVAGCSVVALTGIVTWYAIPFRARRTR